jgi:CPA2 family monovalent cation:H+ antiporter-2
MEQAALDTAHLENVISNILLFFGIAGVAVPLLQKLKISSVIAYLLCGIIIGPYGLAAFSDDYKFLSYFTIKEMETVKLLGELGIITLMFMIGLELSLNNLKRLKVYIFGIGNLQIIITTLLIFTIALLFGNSVESSILLGASLALSSTAIVMKLIEDKKLKGKPIGVLCFSILLMQDLAVVPILVLAGSFSGGSEDSVIKILIYSLLVGIATVAIILIFGKKILSKLLDSANLPENPEWLIAFIIFIVIGCAAITSYAGLSLALGAFLAGLLIAETKYKDEVEEIIAPLKGLLLGIFFLSIGMMINIEEVLRQPLLLILSVIGIYALKAMVLFPICLFYKVPVKNATEASLYLAQPGEFALLILGAAMSSNLMPAEDVQFFLLVIVISMAFTPLLFKLAPFANKITSRF